MKTSNNNNRQTKWKAYHYAVFSPKNGTGMTGKISFEKPMTPEHARVRVTHDIAVAIIHPGIDFIFDPDNFIILIKPL